MNFEIFEDVDDLLEDARIIHHLRLHFHLLVLLVGSDSHFLDSPDSDFRCFLLSFTLSGPDFRAAKVRILFETADIFCQISSFTPFCRRTPRLFSGNPPDGESRRFPESRLASLQASKGFPVYILPMRPLMRPVLVRPS